MRAIAWFCWFATAILVGAELPERVDNSTSRHFPPIILQTQESCAQEVGLTIMMTYALNRMRGTNAGPPMNQLAGQFQWNFLNRGENRGAEVAEGWELARAMGVPRVHTYPGEHRLGEWPTGYALYHDAMKHRVRGYAFVQMSTTSDLAVLKERLFKGELFAIEGRLKGFTGVTIPEGQFESGKHLVTRWGRKGKGHVMTYVGYDDRIGYDVNGDGRLTNTIDLDDDGEITLADHELGAFIAVNSYGTDWGDQGKTYVLYRESAATPYQRGRWAGTMEMMPTFHPFLTLRLKLQTTSQTAVRLQVKAATGETYAPPLFDGAPTHQAAEPESPEQHSRFVTGKRRLSLGPSRADAEGRLIPVELGIDLTGQLPLNSNDYSLTYWLDSQSPRAAGTLLEAHLRRYHPDGTLVSETTFPEFPRPLQIEPQSTTLAN